MIFFFLQTDKHESQKETKTFLGGFVQALIIRIVSQLDYRILQQ